MNIYLYNCANTYNYGSMMMAENFMAGLNRVSRTPHRYYVETGSDDHVRRLREAVPDVDIVGSPLNALFQDTISKKDFFLALWGKKDILKSSRPTVELVVVLGGDDLTEDYGWKGPLFQAVKLAVLERQGMKVVLLGQTMGPYRSWRRWVMPNLLKRLTRILPRDPLTMKYLQELGLRNLRMTDDLALMPLVRQEKKENLRTQITYCPSELIHRYAREPGREAWLAFNRRILAELLDRYPDKSIVLLAHVLAPPSVDDRPMVQELSAWAEEHFPGRTRRMDQVLLPYQVRDIIGQSYVTVSARMHPVVSSLQCTVPALAFSYSQKYWGIIGERYGLGDAILDVRNQDYGSLLKVFQMRLDWVDRQYEVIRQQMATCNERAEREIQAALQELAALAAND